MSLRNTKLTRNPLCLHCFTEMEPRNLADRTICFEAGTEIRHTCGRYLDGQYRPAREASIYHKAKMLKLEDKPEPTQEPPDGSGRDSPKSAADATRKRLDGVLDALTAHDARTRGKR